MSSEYIQCNPALEVGGGQPTLSDGEIIMYVKSLVFIIPNYYVWQKIFELVNLCQILKISRKSNNIFTYEEKFMIWE